MNNSTICFVSRNEIFVTPFTRLALRSLRSVGFGEERFYVPFSNGDYPKFEQVKWNDLIEKAYQSLKEDFVDDCILYSDEHYIGTIRDETLRNCFEMPSTGVKVKNRILDSESLYYPILNSTCFCSTTGDCIGHYCTNNGIVVFVYRNGKTYVANGYDILEELRARGYTESPMFVPFSNGEQILDPVLKARWESIIK